MASRIFALIIWAAVAASLAYWGLRWLARPTGVPANATPVALDGGSQGDPHRLLTGPVKASGPTADPSAASALASRLKLLGVVAPRDQGGGVGVALVSVDGKPPRAYRVGSPIEGDLVVQSLTQRGATIGPANGAAVTTLDLPLLPPPSTGALPPVGGVIVSPENNGGLPPGGMAQQNMAPPPPPNMAPGTAPGMAPGMAPNGAPSGYAGPTGAMQAPDSSPPPGGFVRPSRAR